MTDQTNKGLPPVPDPAILWHSDLTNQTYYGYTREHMNDYGRACATAALSASAPAAVSVPSDDRLLFTMRNIEPHLKDVDAAIPTLLIAARALLVKYGNPAWRPIETAPAGKRVLLGPRESPVVGIVDFYEDEATGEKEPHARVVHYNGGIFVSRYHCSEWMPLPPAPQEGK